MLERQDMNQAEKDLIYMRIVANLVLHDPLFGGPAAIDHQR